MLRETVEASLSGMYKEGSPPPTQGQPHPRAALEPGSASSGFVGFPLSSSQIPEGFVPKPWIYMVFRNWYKALSF